MGLGFSWAKPALPCNRMKLLAFSPSRNRRVIRDNLSSIGDHNTDHSSAIACFDKPGKMAAD